MNDEIKTGLKTWEMLKLVEENPEALIKPEETPFGFEHLRHMSIVPFLKKTWSVKVPPKKVTITRQDLNIAWKAVNAKGHHSLDEMAKELGL